MTEHYQWMACPRCKTGVLKPIQETLKDNEPFNECTDCKTRFKIYLEEDNEGNEFLNFVEVGL